MKAVRPAETSSKRLAVALSGDDRRLGPAARVAAAASTDCRISSANRVRSGPKPEVHRRQARDRPANEVGLGDDRHGSERPSAWTSPGGSAGPPVASTSQSTSWAWPNVPKAAADAFGLDGTLGCPQARSVGHDHRIAAEVEPYLERIPRGPGFGRDDGDIPPGERIEQARLAGIGWPGQHHPEAVAQDLAAVAVGQMGVDWSPRPAAIAAAVAIGIRGNIRLVRKVEAGLGQRQRLKKLLPPTLV